MVRWRDSRAERVALEQQLERVRGVERAAYQYLAGCLMAIHPEMGTAAVADPEAWLAALERPSGAAPRRRVAGRRRALPRPDAG